MVDAKDEYTKGHSQRVAEYSASIAMESGYDEEAVSNVQCIGSLCYAGEYGRTKYAITSKCYGNAKSTKDKEYDLDVSEAYASLRSVLNRCHWHLTPIGAADFHEFANRICEGTEQIRINGICIVIIMWLR